MNIINLTPNESSGYPPIQTWNGAKPPDGYAEISVDCDTAPFYEYRGFVTLTLTDDVITGITGNQDALDAYLAEHPDTEPEAEPDVWDEMAAAINEGVNSLDE